VPQPLRRQECTDIHRDNAVSTPSWPWAYRNDPWLDSHDDDGVFFPLCKGVASAYRKSIAPLHRFDIISVSVLRFFSVEISLLKGRS